MQGAQEVAYRSGCMGICLTHKIIFPLALVKFGTVYM